MSNSLATLFKARKLQHERTIKACLLVVLCAILLAGTSVPLVVADQFDDQIKQLQKDNSQKNQAATDLEVQADSLQGAINQLQSQINSLQSQIDANNARNDDLQKQIVAAEAELARQRGILGENIRAMYLDGQISTLEMLASSKDLSSFFDKQQYRDIVKDKIKNTLDKVTALKTQLRTQKEEVERLLAEQHTLQGNIATQKAQQDQLLNANLSEQNSLNQTIKANFSRISELRREQAVANARLFGFGLQNIPDTSGYPWPNVPFPDGGYDPWGMGYRQCVSYTAWHVWKDGKYMPAWGLLGLGNANQWPGDARAYGIPVDSNPTPGSVAIKDIGAYGHSMYVEHNYGDGTILVSQYNGLWDGNYSMARVSTAGMVFIHFQ